MISERALHGDIEVDGGMYLLLLIVGQAGAHLLVAGCAIYKDKESVQEAMNKLRSAINIYLQMSGDSHGILTFDRLCTLF
jgi:pentose-5-phosphate-3-epimerase